MKPARRLTTCVVALITTAVMASCSSVEPQDPQAQTQTGENLGKPAPANVRDGGALTIALNEDPDQLDPTLARSLVGRQVFHTMCEKLYDLDENVRIVPQLAAALPQISSDGRTVTIPLRQGVRFADGTPFDAAAVKKTLDRHLTLETSVRKSELGPIEAVEATNPQTVTIRLERPTAPLTAALADRAGMIMSPAALERLGEKFSSDPVCVGPFKFSARVPQSTIEVVKDPNYYDADRVHLDRIVYRIITDASIRAANLRSGDAQVVDTLSTEDVPQMSADETIEVLRSGSLGYQAVTFNVGNVDGVGTQPKRIDRPMAADPRVRIAFEHAIDRKALVDTVFRGIFQPACSPISPQTAYTSARAQQCRAHDPAKSRQLLQQAGVPIPFPIKILTPNDPVQLRLAQTLQAMVKEAGFAVEIQPSEFSALLDQQDQGEYEAVRIGWSGRVDPDANITAFIGTRGTQNVAGYSNPAIDRLLDQARTRQQPAERAQTYAQVIDLLQRDNPLVYLYRVTNLTAVSAKVAGVRGFADGIIRVAFAGYLP